MICSAKPALTEDLGAKCSLDERPGIFMRDKPIFSSERMLDKDYYHKSSVGKRISGRGSQGA
jgi:hypothetical protein